MDQHIYLTGYRGSGKSSTGRQLAQMLNLPFVDLDDEIEIAAEKSIREIFSEGGEESFRNWEAKCLRRIASNRHSVIALGGGAILRSENRDLIRETGFCIWLQADAKVLLRRIQGDDATGERRPSLTNLPALDEIRTVLQERESMYQAAADRQMQVDDVGPEQVASLICDMLGYQR